MKTTSEQRKQPAAKRGRYDGLFHAARRAANREKLFLLAEDTESPNPKWSFFDLRQAGRVVLVYRPRTRRWSGGSGNGLAKRGWSEAIRIAVLIRDRQVQRKGA